ncbi:SRPBCC family protein [Thermoleophilum album]|uniref:Ligand-binding SRPBCC domain-containing protein n=1 Tax=Thermoleophilum album TaxID=29539 RepID=A0A1H6FPR7_THEAL|nr:SRPBCC family protein [Thermoleophilum album]SEH12118.1 Ligand-binding SRPBCC domain-containing protein [Thermoleophilum album]
MSRRFAVRIGLPRVHRFEQTQLLPGDPATVFPFFADPRNLERLTPPWLRFRIERAPETVEEGSEIAYTLRVRGLPVRWLTAIVVWEPPHRFVDLQVAGPYRTWHHTHSFEPHPRGTLMRDVVVYALPFGPLGEIVHHAFVRRDIEQIFAYRRTALGQLFDAREDG